MPFLRSPEPAAIRGHFGLVGQTPILLELVRQLEVIAALDAPVLLEGEPGVGRALAASVLHRSSHRAMAPYVVLDASEVSPALFESELFGVAEGAYAGALASRPGLALQAEPGTLVIEEVGSLPWPQQARLARFVESRRAEPVGAPETSRRAVNVRRVLTAARPVSKESPGAEGPVRAAASLEPALRRALSAFTLVVPTLRSRREDLPLLARHFAREAMLRHAKRLGEISGEVLTLLAAYSWPGNVQELEEEMERAVILTPAGEPITAEVLSSKVSGRNHDPLGTGLS